MTKKLTFYFIRHGRTVWNEQGLLQGEGDSPLTEKGILGAKLTGEALANTPFIAAYSSCLQRTIDTTKYILNGRDIPLFQHRGLNEHFFGNWEGLLVDELRPLPAFQQLLHDPANYTAEINKGETYYQLGERAVSALYDIIKIHHHGNILIVSHGHTLRLLIALLQGATVENHREQVEALLNTSISVIHYEQTTSEDKGHFRIEYINNSDHLI